MSLAGMREGARFCSDGCRVRHWREARTAPEERLRTAARDRKREARASGVIASDVRLSYGKTVSVLAAHIQCVDRVPELVARRMAQELLHDALPARLREAA